jgi:hypothetical protein
MNVSAIPRHVINGLAVRQDGVSGDGSRQITYNLYFSNHGSSVPETAPLKDVPDDAVLYAEEAIGYTTVTLQFEVDGETYTIIGKAICSSSDDYNGNLGVIFALRNAFDQIEARKINTPIIIVYNLIRNFQDIIAIAMRLEDQKGK